MDFVGVMALSKLKVERRGRESMTCAGGVVVEESQGHSRGLLTKRRGLTEVSQRHSPFTSQQVALSPITIAYYRDREMLH